MKIGHWTNQDTVFVVYARKTTRHNWSEYGTHSTAENGELDTYAVVRFLKSWDAGQVALVRFETKDTNGGIPDAVKDLPGVQLSVKNIGGK